MIKSGKDEFKNDGENIIFTGKYMELYIDNYYFEKGATEIIGDTIKTLGIVSFRTFQDEDGKKPNKMRTLNIPMVFYTYPSGGFSKEKMDLNGNGKLDDIYVLKYYNGDILCAAQLRSDTQTFTMVMNILLAGKFPTSIPYHDVYGIWENSFIMNGVSFDIPDWCKEMIVAQIYRDPKNPSDTFGKALGQNPKLNPLAYKQANSRTVAATQSSFNGVIFEDFDQMMINGINGTKENRKENISPMEEVLKY